MPQGGTIFNERGSPRPGIEIRKKDDELSFKHRDVEIRTDCSGGDTQEETDHVGLDVWRELRIGKCRLAIISIKMVVKACRSDHLRQKECVRAQHEKHLKGLKRKRPLLRPSCRQIASHSAVSDIATAVIYSYRSRLFL